MTWNWYEIVPAQEPLDQGDILLGCPVASWQEGPVTLSSQGKVLPSLREAIVVTEMDVVVMTQTCDLAQNKVRYVTLCPHYALTIYREEWEAAQRAAGQVPTTKSWTRHIDHITAGQIWNLALLNAEEGQEHQVPHRVVDFQEVLSLPRDFLESWLFQTAQPRLRLLPPYREHLSQAFARFFMRVGLPVDIRKDWR